MKQIIYIKYNRTRKKEYQIQTSICLEDEVKYAEKCGLCAEAKTHIQSFIEKQKVLNQVYKNVQFTEVSLVTERVARFPYVEGITLQKKIVNELKNSSTLEASIKIINNYIEKLLECYSEYKQEFEETSEFKAVFGNANLKKEEALLFSNVDLIFENVIECGQKWIGIDYEWVFDFPIPIDFIKYRILHYFYVEEKNWMEQIISEDQLLTAFGLQERKEEFARMESSFQEYVFGEKAEYRYMDQYKNESIKAKEVLETLEETKKTVQNCENKITDYENRIADYENRITDYESKIEGKTYEKQKLEQQIIDKERHIRNLEAMITELRLLEVQAKKWDKLMHFFPIRCARYIKKTTKKCKNKIIGMHREKIYLPMSKKPKVSIIIPAYNQFDYTYECIKSIAKNSNDCEYEVILADDVSTDQTKQIQRIVKGLIVSRNNENLRFLRNCNKAAKLAKGKYILFLNNDTTVQEGWLSSLVELIESSADIGMVGSKLIYPDGTLQEAGGIIWNDATGWNYGRNDDASKPEYNYVRDVDYISGAAIMIKADLWEQIGGFDELFAPAYCEDSDLAFAVRKLGYRVVYQPKSVVVHYEGISNGTDINSGLKKYQVENSEKFKLKWERELKNQCEPGQEIFKAKDRLQSNKRVVLFVDHYVPTFDKDAGARTVMQYIKMFLKHGYCVKFIGDNYAKMEPYTTILEQMGVEVYWGVWYQENIWKYLEENEKYINYIFLNRPHISTKYIDFMKEKMSAKIMFYGSDLHYMRVQREAELTNSAERKKEVEYWKNMERDLLEKVDVAYYLSPIEKEEIAKFNPNIVVRNIKINIFENFVENINLNFMERKGIIFVGGFTHTPNVDAVKWFLGEIYPLIAPNGEIPFYIVGSNPPDEIKDLCGQGVVLKGYVSDEELKTLYSNCRMAVVPLRYGAGIKGKVIEALYYGIPLVTTSIGAEGIDEIEKYVDIVDGSTAFAEQVLEMYDDTAKLRVRACESQKYVRKMFSEEAAWNVIEQDFT